MKKNILSVLLSMLFTAASASGAWIKVDDRDGSVTYTGTWQNVGQAQAYNGTTKWSYPSGTGFEFTFTGTGIRFYTFDCDNGNVDLYIDGEYQTTVNVNGSCNASILKYENTSLSLGPHTLSGTVISGEVEVDAFEYDSGGPPDEDPPAPDPMEWQTEPNSYGGDSITMTAVTATDASGVEYFFEEISSNPGGDDSFWKSSPSYTDHGLDSDTTYTYRVRARDTSINQNQTDWSTAVSATTGADLAPAPQMEWHKGYGPSFGTHVHEGFQTSDGGYIGIGQTIEDPEDPCDPPPDMVIIKTYSNGNKEWQKVIGTSNQFDIGICIAEVSDGFICGGGLYDSGNQKRALVKLNKTTGDIVPGWPKYYSGLRNSAIRGIDILGDGSIVATGYKNCSGAGYVFIVDDGDGFIMKTDADGNVIWDKDLSVPQGTKVRADGSGFAVCSTAWFSSGGEEAVLIKTDSSGNETNKYHFGGTNSEHCYDFDLTSDGGYILGGHTTSYGVANWDYYLVKVNSSGVEEWHKTFGQPRGYNDNYIHDEAYGVRQTPDGGYVIVGGSGDEYESYSSCTHSCGCSDIWMAYLVKTDSGGNKLWEDVYPCWADAGHTAGEYLGLTSDGGYIVFTDTDAFWDTVGAEAMGFMKIAPDFDPIDEFNDFIVHWLDEECGDCGGADYSGDGNVKLDDFVIFYLEHWLQ